MELPRPWRLVVIFAGVLGLIVSSLSQPQAREGTQPALQEALDRVMDQQPQPAPAVQILTWTRRSDGSWRSGPGTVFAVGRCFGPLPCIKVSGPTIINWRGPWLSRRSFLGHACDKFYRPGPLPVTEPDAPAAGRVEAPDDGAHICLK